LRQAGRTDRLEHTINYAEVYYLVKVAMLIACFFNCFSELILLLYKHIVEGEPHKLIESVAEDVAMRILSQYVEFSLLAILSVFIC